MVTQAKPFLLVVDDDPLIADTLEYALSRDFEVRTAATRLEAGEKLPPPNDRPMLALVDLGLPPTPHRPNEGFALITELLARVPDIRIIVLSGQNEEANARHARALGALDFVAKPASPDKLRQVLLSALDYTPDDSTVARGPELLGDSLSMQKLRLQIRQYANSPFSVLIEGESGSGKEVVAGSLHRFSDRAQKPFLALNCAAISPNLVEPTLFGHAKGAYTGAAGARAGYFEDAADGLLFLDEIGELPLDLQPKLLRVLENGAFQRVGETQERISRARVIAATNRDLRKEVREGRFRADLYHRLSVFTIAVPPLRDMADDKLLLLNHFRAAFAEQAGQPAFTLTPEATALWSAYHFPGNVRELKNIVIRLATKHAGQPVDGRELGLEFDIMAHEDDAAAATLDRSPEHLVALATTELTKEEHFSLDETLKAWEAAYIEAAQRLAQGNTSQAARLLGVNRTTLYNRMEALSRHRKTV